MINKLTNKQLNTLWHKIQRRKFEGGTRRKYNMQRRINMIEQERSWLEHLEWKKGRA